MNIKGLEQGLRHSFINKTLSPNKNYQPELLVNDNEKGKKFLSHLLTELDSCDNFWICVAFVTTSGIATIINSLIDLEKKGVRGRILVSQYLNFTQPEALKRLKKFKNIELKISVNDSFHSKGYLFTHGETSNIIVGSSNLTQTAVSSNKEWNLKITSSINGSINHEIKEEFEKEFSAAQPVTKSFIEEYSSHWKASKVFSKQMSELHKSFTRRISPNQMQEEALENLASLRAENKKKALLISATGTGKTYLSAFDVKQFKPKKFLFVVHRRTIAEKAMETFQSLLGSSKTMGVFSGSKKELECDYIFSTVQTVSKVENLALFQNDHFEYIVIDETHRAGANSYKKILEYFKPKFLLGMTATPERTDGEDIFKLFDYNIAYEIRLHNALSQNMLCPFHYYGVTDITVNDEIIDDKSDFNKLTCDERVKHIIKTSKLYGTDSGEIKGLIFCSKNEISRQLSLEFQANGLKTIVLSGDSSEDERVSAIKKLERNEIDYIFTVDIFNEGIDIPSVNQIIMLRPTQSAIIFVQQLGRGLRKSKSKEYLTVIDFIGNYNNNYLVPIALYGDTSFNKDSIRKLLAGGSSMIPGSSTVNFDEISKEKVFDSINKANMQKLTDLKKDYQSLKNKIGRIPTMIDFIEFGSRDPWLYASYKKSYLNFINIVEEKYRNITSKTHNKLLEHFTLNINNGKRLEESLLLQLLIQNDSLSKLELRTIIKNQYGYEPNEEVYHSIVNNLNFEFIRQSYKIVSFKNDTFTIGEDLSKALQNSTFKYFLLDNIDYSIMSYKNKFELNMFESGLIRNQKYGRKDVCRLLNWDKDISATLYGYRTKNNQTPCFVTYHKSKKLEGDINYNDHFINSSIFSWESRSNRKLESQEIQNVIESKRILLFVKKEDGEGTDFYYLGDVSILPDSITQDVTEKGAPVVHFKFKLAHPVDDELYNYIINE
ncbi:DEAD/DEAH box helicase [Polaribacter marinivivus]|uniref:DEAD/DEAH box helicase n=1 Tax=Polaribacter marinivivus TaxID=1524260 RepID=UPI003D330C78